MTDKLNGTTKANEEEFQKEQIKLAPLPKRDFPTMIKHDTLYLSALSQELEHKLIKLDILSKECQLVPKTKQGVIDNIDLLTEFSVIQREIYDIKGKKATIEALIKDKKQHYTNVFLPQYQKEIDESNKHFVSVLKEVKGVMAKKEDKIYDGVKNKMRMEIEAFEEVVINESDNEERQMQLYKPLKRLLANYKKRVQEVLDMEKYK